MSFRLRSIEFLASGRRMVRDRDIDKVVLTVGRAAENDIHLPDLGVDPFHARIVADTNSLVSVESLSGLGFSLDGKNVQSAKVDCLAGAELAFGFYRLTLGRDEDGTLLIEVQNSAGGSEHADPIDQKKAFALTRSLWGKRPMAWALAALILALFLGWPIASNLTRAAAPTRTIAADRAWNAGALSLAHHSLTNNCAACHVKPFQAVRNETCISCHKDVHDHAPAARLAMAMAPPGPGGAMLQTTAHVFGKPGPGACVDCHVEHRGAGQMEPASQQFCADCHAALKDRLPDTKVGNAADFATLHPQFTATIVANADTGALARVALDGHAREDNGLTFSHNIHLDPRGGVAKMATTLGAQGFGQPLGCQNCHRPSEDGVRFQPVSMERDCEACHSLVYDRVGGTFRKLRHGDVAQMVADLNAAGARHPTASARMRPGEYANGGIYHASFASGGGAVAQAMSSTGLCGQCHTPEMRNGKLAVKPVTLLSRYMQHGWFDHSAHRQTACADCHAAKQSRSSADVLLPGISTCRECHAGDSGGAINLGTKIPSNCAMCHTYHVVPGAPRGATIIRRLRDQSLD